MSYAIYDGWCLAKGFGHESEKCPYCGTVEESELQDCFSCPYWYWEQENNDFSLQNDNSNNKKEEGLL